jgi:hypothetical protein
MTVSARPGVSVRGALGAELYVLIVAGITAGALVVGAGSRVAMMVLRLTSADSVKGVISDDGFTIGRATLGGTYNLFMLGAVVGIIGAAAYQWVRPWLLGPRWFRRCTVALASGAVGGAMLVHADGVDFRLLTPLWLTIGLFVALPAVFAVTVAVVVDRVERTALDEATSRRGWILPVVLVAVFPATLIVLAVGTGVLLVWVIARELPALRRLARARATGVVARAAWLGIAVFGLVVLVGDIADVLDAV